MLPLKHHCFRDLTAVKIKTTNGRETREIILGSAYLPYNDVEQLPHEELHMLVMGCCRDEWIHLINGCDVNSQYSYWMSTNFKNRGESLFNNIMANGLDIMNRGNRPTFLHLTGRKLLILQLPLFMPAIT